MKLTNTLLVFVLTFGATTIANANADIISQIKLLDQEYLICNNAFANTGSPVRYQQCLDEHYEKYDQLIKSIRALKSFNQKEKWMLINTNISNHAQLCKESAQRSPNRFVPKEISLCNNFMYKALAIEALNLSGE